ncbi:MAG: CocE/NonD family hydrolase [Promethearchaeota archaeon]
MPDGVVLLADFYYPRKGGKRPIILVRSPYGRTSFFGLFYGRLLAKRGFQVLTDNQVELSIIATCIKILVGQE